MHMEAHACECVCVCVCRVSQWKKSNRHALSHLASALPEILEHVTRCFQPHTQVALVLLEARDSAT